MCTALLACLCAVSLSLASASSSSSSSPFSALASGGGGGGANGGGGKVSAALQTPEGRTYAITMSLLAGMATSIGGIMAIVSKPDDARLAFLLGIAVGVMASLSIVELLINNAVEHGALGVSASCVLGAIFYAVVEPLLPESSFDEASFHAEPADDPKASSLPPLAKRVQLLRLGFLMAVTMTLHNLPEGFAVAFASHADFGTAVTLAVAVHNIPEGVIVAAPIYAATGSRMRALAIATVSGLSEPLGALIALTFLHKHLTELRLAYLLAFTGGVMGAVCVLELWPEGKRCRNDRKLFEGSAVGVLLMLGTLYAGA
ncbi:zinc transporter ZupT [Pycnococcus provasolii]